MSKQKNFASELRKIGACPEAVAWVGARDRAAFWRECPNPFWMLRYAERVGVPLRQFVRAAARLTELALHLAGEDFAVCRATIGTALVWAKHPSRQRAAWAAEAAAWAAAGVTDAATRAAAWAGARAAAMAAEDEIACADVIRRTIRLPKEAP